MPKRRKRASAEDLVRLGMSWLVEPDALATPVADTSRSLAAEIITLAREARAQGEPYVGALSMPRSLIVPLSVLQPAAPDVAAVGVAVQQARRAARNRDERRALDRWVAAVVERAASEELVLQQDEEDLIEVLGATGWM